MNFQMMNFDLLNARCKKGKVFQQLICNRTYAKIIIAF
jgi:hypothetical protein